MARGIGAGLACKDFFALKLCPGVYGWEYSGRVYAGSASEFFEWARAR